MSGSGGSTLRKVETLENEHRGSFSSVLEVPLPSLYTPHCVPRLVILSRLRCHGCLRMVEQVT